MLLSVWFREKESEEEILRALEMLLEVDSTAHVDVRHYSTVRGEFRWDAAAGPYGDAETRGGGAATTPVSQQQRPAPFDGKLAWDAYRTQLELLAGHSLNCWR